MYRAERMCARRALAISLSLLEDQKANGVDEA